MPLSLLTAHKHSCTHFRPHGRAPPCSCWPHRKCSSPGLQLVAILANRNGSPTRSGAFVFSFSVSFLLSACRSASLSHFFTSSFFFFFPLLFFFFSLTLPQGIIFLFGFYVIAIWGWGSGTKQKSRWGEKQIQKEESAGWEDESQWQRVQLCFLSLAFWQQNEPELLLIRMILAPALGGGGRNLEQAWVRAFTWGIPFQKPRSLVSSKCTTCLFKGVQNFQRAEQRSVGQVPSDDLIPPVSESIILIWLNPPFVVFVTFGFYVCFSYVIISF